MAKNDQNQVRSSLNWSKLSCPNLKMKGTIYKNCEEHVVSRYWGTWITGTLDPLVQALWPSNAGQGVLDGNPRRATMLFAFHVLSKLCRMCAWRCVWLVPFWQFFGLLFFLEARIFFLAPNFSKITMHVS